MANKKCKRPDCLSNHGLATYEFEIEGFEDEPDTTVAYCAPCVAQCVTQGMFSEYEVYSLRLVR